MYLRLLTLSGCEIDHLAFSEHQTVHSRACLACVTHVYVVVLRSSAWYGDGFCLAPCAPSSDRIRRGVVVNTPASYFGRPRYESQSRDRQNLVSFLRFPVVFLSPSRKIHIGYNKRGHYHFFPRLPNSSPIIIVIRC